jgi:hypothetical protein
METDEPGASEAATISRFSASGHDRLRRRRSAELVSITGFVDTSDPHNAEITSDSAKGSDLRRRLSAEGYINPA